MSCARPALLLAVVALAAGCDRQAARPVEPADVILLDAHVVPWHERPGTMLDTAQGLVATVRERERERVLISADDGGSWSEIGSLPPVPRAWAVHDGCPELHRIDVTGQGLLHVRGLGAAASSARVADAGPVEVYALAIADTQRLGVVWIDHSPGWPELMFSQSVDHGSSWSPAVRINTESRLKEIATPSLLPHRGGWVVVWVENRDARTLYDVYASYSEDGRSWQPSRRLNDDQQACFSVAPVIATDASAVHVLTQDYREVNRFGDRDANIYYARMVVGSSATVPNTRVNDVTDAPQSMPTLAVDGRTGWLVAAWLDDRHRLTCDVYTSTSADGGLSWSPNRRVNAGSLPASVDRPWVTPRRAGGVYILWRETRGALTHAWLGRIEPGRVAGAPRPPEPDPVQVAGPLVEPLPPRRLLAEERFDGPAAPAFRPLTGSWLVRDGALLGFGYGVAIAEWSGPPLADFELEGRFRLDRREHLGAHLFLRTQRVPGVPHMLAGYHVKNHFRMGVMLSESQISTDLDRAPEVVHEPLADRWIPLRQETWYAFRAVVVGSRLDYWLDGQWLLSYDGLEPRAGGILLAADSLSPVEWDDLRVYSLDASQDASSR